jgi:hypothetical protein
MGPGSGVLNSGMRRVQQTMRFSDAAHAARGTRTHGNGSQRGQEQVKRAKGDVRDVDARRRSARMCLEASLAYVPSSEQRRRIRLFGADVASRR